MLEPDQCYGQVTSYSLFENSCSGLDIFSNTVDLEWIVCRRGKTLKSLFFLRVYRC